MIRRIEPGGLEAWRLAAWMVILQPAAWRLGGLAAWMLVARMDLVILGGFRCVVGESVSRPVAGSGV